MDKTKMLVYVAGTIVCAAVVGFVGYSYTAYRSAYASQGINLARTSLALSDTVVRYGVVRSVDPSTRIVTIDVKNTYEQDGAPMSIQVEIKRDAYIARQNLIESDGIYTGASDTTPTAFAEFAATPVMTKVKFLQVNAGGSFKISYLVFGNPL